MTTEFSTGANSNVHFNLFLTGKMFEICLQGTSPPSVISNPRSTSNRLAPAGLQPLVWHIGSSITINPLGVVALSYTAPDGIAWMT